MTDDSTGNAPARQVPGGSPPLRSDEEIAGRTAVIGAAIGFVLCVAAVFGIGVAAGIEPGGALALGAFVGVWGGAGFGFMVGGTKNIADPERESGHHHPLAG